jgi:uncharacterized membrane protein
MRIIKTFGPSNKALPATIHEWLLLSSFFSCLLLFIRIVGTGTPAYLFLPWNLFLAFIPYWITGWMRNKISLIENKLTFFFLLALWLLFVPNSFYIITDLFHLSRIGDAPKWFDVLMIFSFAWNGILCGIISLRRVEVFVSMMYSKSFSFLLIFSVMWLSGFGIYVGRFLRFNSWDVITDPFSLIAEIMDMVFHPFANGYAWGMTMCYGVIMTLVYLTIQKAGEMFMADR